MQSIQYILFKRNSVNKTWYITDAIVYLILWPSQNGPSRNLLEKLENNLTQGIFYRPRHELVLALVGSHNRGRSQFWVYEFRILKKTTYLILDKIFISIQLIF